jgi:hypothetical protein
MFDSLLCMYNSIRIITLSINPSCMEQVHPSNIPSTH